MSFERLGLISEYKASMDNCKTNPVAWWIKERDWFDGVKDPLGKVVLNSCKKDFCRSCARRRAKERSLNIFTKIERYKYIYHVTFSPSNEVWLDFKDNYKLVRKVVQDSFKNYFENYGLVVCCHYLGDKDENYNIRLHFHMLLFSDVPYPSVALNSKDYDYCQVQDQKSEIWNYIEENLGFDEYVNFHVVDLKKRARREGLKFNLFRDVVGYQTNYMSFVGKALEYNDIDEILEYFFDFKLNIVNYCGSFRKGKSDDGERLGYVSVYNKTLDRNKVVVGREKLTRPYYYRGFKMVCKSIWYLHENHIKPIDIDFWLDEEEEKLKIKKDEFLRRCAVAA